MSAEELTPIQKFKNKVLLEIEEEKSKLDKKTLSIVYHLICDELQAELEQTQTSRERKLYEALEEAYSYIGKCVHCTGEEPNMELIDKALDECKPNKGE